MRCENISFIGDASAAQAQTSIQVRPEMRRAAENVASTLGVPVSRVSEVSNLSGADIRVVLGADQR